MERIPHPFVPSVTDQYEEHIDHGVRDIIWINTIHISNVSSFSVVCVSLFCVRERSVSRLLSVSAGTRPLQTGRNGHFNPKTIYAESESEVRKNPFLHLGCVPSEQSFFSSLLLTAFAWFVWIAFAKEMPLFRPPHIAHAALDQSFSNRHLYT